MKLRLALAAVATAAAIFAGAGSAVQAAPHVTVVKESVTVAKVAVPNPVIHASCEYNVDSDVKKLAWAEIARLELLGYPVCSDKLIWAFNSNFDKGIWGLAYPQVTETDARHLIIIEQDEADYDGYELAEAVRTTVRHELGHVLTYETGDIAIDPTHELAADAIAEALTPAGEARTVFYAETITPAELAAAQDILAPYTAQTL